MKTIAISIDEPMLETIDRIAGGAGQPESSEGHQKLSRSEIIRMAIRDFITRHEKLTREERERKILAKHREQLAQQAEALVAEQAEP